MPKRYVFKFFASVGPGGSFASTVEQICTSVYASAYTVGDEDDMESAVDKQLKEMREEFVNALFDIKDEFKEAAASEDQDVKDEAYSNLIAMLKKYIAKMTRLEKNKYMRERVYYQRTNQFALYEKANRAYMASTKDVEDNLLKQCKTVCKPSEEDF